MSRFRKLSHAIWHCQYHLVGIDAVSLGTEKIRRYVKCQPPLGASPTAPLWGAQAKPRALHVDDLLKKLPKTQEKSCVRTKELYLDTQWELLAFSDYFTDFQGGFSF